jgi:putative FmdB family regulatory protein
MPTYEYRCKQGHDFEVMQRMSDDPIVECEVCGAPVQKVFSPVAVHYKGKGFYSTDYGSKNRARELKETAEATKKADKSSSDSSSSDSSSSDSSSSDSKKKSEPAPAKAESKASAAD